MLFNEKSFVISSLVVVGLLLHSGFVLDAHALLSFSYCSSGLEDQYSLVETLSKTFDCHVNSE